MGVCSGNIGLLIMGRLFGYSLFCLSLASVLLLGPSVNFEIKLGFIIL